MTKRVLSLEQLEAKLKTVEEEMDKSEVGSVSHARLATIRGDVLDKIMEAEGNAE